MNSEKEANHKCRIKTERNAKCETNRRGKRKDERKETCLEEKERKLRVDQTRRVKGGRTVSL